MIPQEHKMGETQFQAINYIVTALAWACKALTHDRNKTVGSLQLPLPVWWAGHFLRRPGAPRLSFQSQGS